MGSNNPTVPSSNISFSSLKSAYADASITSASGNSNLTDGNTNTPISLSFFRNATFTDSSSVPSSGELSINDDFKSKTFGSSSSPEFEWYYYAYGSNINTIYIYWLNSSNNSLNTLRTVTFQQHTSATQSWLQYTEDLSSRIQSEIQEAISTWLPYINISNVNIIQSDEDPNTTSVDIDFALNYEPDRFNSITLNFDGDSESTSTSGGGGY